MAVVFEALVVVFFWNFFGTSEVCIQSLFLMSASAPHLDHRDTRMRGGEDVHGEEALNFCVSKGSGSFDLESSLMTFARPKKQVIWPKGCMSEARGWKPTGPYCERA